MQSILESFEPQSHFVHSWLDTGSFAQIFPELELPSYEQLWDLNLIHQPPITVFGKPGVQHRDVGFYCDHPEVSGYHYSAGVTMNPQPMPDFLRQLTDRITEYFNSDHNACLVNRYRDGSDTIGDHSDNETTLGKGGVISLTIYERPDHPEDQRIFRIRSRHSGFMVETPDGELSSGKKLRVLDHKITHGEILLMGGKFQSEFTHGIPAQKKIQHGRISLTWRTHTS